MVKTFFFLNLSANLIVTLLSRGKPEGSKDAELQVLFIYYNIIIRPLIITKNNNNKILDICAGMKILNKKKQKETRKMYTSMKNKNETREKAKNKKKIKQKNAKEQKKQKKTRRTKTKQNKTKAN